MELSTDSKRSARMLLAAWDSSDLLRIQDAAERAAAVSPAMAPEADRIEDAERMEMVRVAAGVLRQHIEGKEGCPDAELDASLRLLRHLAGAAVREAVPLGRHACARR
jgi:hypothetical protein